MNSHKQLIVGLAVAIIVLVALGWLAYRYKYAGGISAAQTDHPAGDYMSFTGNYVFSVPKSLTVNDSVIPSAQLLYTNGVSYQGVSIDQLYQEGVIALQPLSPVSGDFKQNIEGSVKPALEKALDATVTVSYHKTKGVDVAVLQANKDGQPVRVEYIYFLKNPVVIAAKAVNDQFTTVANSLQSSDTYHRKTEVDAARNVVVNIFELMKNKKTTDIYALSSQKLKETSTVDQLATALQNSTKLLARNIDIHGGVITDQSFVAHAVFVDIDNKKSQPMPGSVTLVKDHTDWKMDGFELVTDQAADTANQK